MFRDQLALHLPFLIEWGYGEPTFDYQDETLLPAILARFRSATRQLTFTLVVDHSRLPDAPERQVITAHVYRGSGHDEDDRLSVDWFAALHRPDLDDQHERAADECRSIEEFVCTVLPVYSTLFRENMREILAGSAWESGAGDRGILRKFEFLESDFGFSRPIGRWCGHDLTHTYRRGDVKVSVTWDGGPHEVMAITVGNQPPQFIWRTLPEQVIALLKRHPEIFEGDFRALSALTEGTSRVPRG